MNPVGNQSKEVTIPLGTDGSVVQAVESEVISLANYLELSRSPDYSRRTLQGVRLRDDIPMVLRSSLSGNFNFIDYSHTESHEPKHEAEIEVARFILHNGLGSRRTTIQNEHTPSDALAKNHTFEVIRSDREESGIVQLSDILLALDMTCAPKKKLNDLADPRTNNTLSVALNETADRLQSKAKYATKRNTYMEDRTILSSGVNEYGTYIGEEAASLDIIYGKNRRAAQYILRLMIPARVSNGTVTQLYSYQLDTAKNHQWSSTLQITITEGIEPGNLNVFAQRAIVTFDAISAIKHAVSLIRDKHEL